MRANDLISEEDFNSFCGLFQGLSFARRWRSPCVNMQGRGVLSCGGDARAGPADRPLKRLDFCRPLSSLKQSTSSGLKRETLLSDLYHFIFRNRSRDTDTPGYHLFYTSLVSNHHHYLLPTSLPKPCAFISFVSSLQHHPRSAIPSSRDKRRIASSDQFDFGN